jgi:hypothetical protein
VKWEHDYLFPWTTPSDQEEAEADGQEFLSEVLRDLETKGITFVQTGDVHATEVEDTFYNDQRYTAELRLVAYAPWLTEDALDDLATGAEMELFFSGVGTNVQSSGPLPGGFAGSTGASGYPMWVRGPLVLMAAAGAFSTVVHFTGDRLERVADKTLAPLAAIALVYLATRLKL